MGKDEATSPVILVLLIVLGAGFVFFLVVPRTAHHDHSESAAIGALKAVGSAQSLFREGDKDGNKTLDYGTLTQLAQQQLIDSVTGAGTKQGYNFTAGPGTGAPEFVWWATATPSAELVKRIQARSFFANHEGVIWYTTGAVVAPITSLAAPPPGWQVVGK